jgi:hypothetical protein
MSVKMMGSQGGSDAPEVSGGDELGAEGVGRQREGVDTAAQEVGEELVGVLACVHNYYY